MIVRPATDKDWPAIWLLIQDVFRKGDTYAVDPQITEAEAHEYWVTTAEVTYVAEHAGQITGTYFIKTNQAGGGAHICNCGYVVDAAWRGHGVAWSMRKASQAQALGQGYLAMQFNFVLASNVGALRLWHRLGFDTVGTIPDAFDHPVNGMVDAYVMYKRLGTEK